MMGGGVAAEGRFLMAKRTGLYPGTFDPITNGHIDIIRRAVKLFDRLVIGVAINEGKGPLFPLDERVDLVKHEVAPIAQAAGVTITVEPFDILLMHFAEKVGANFIIRGLRAVSDFEYEFQMVGMNMALNREIEMVFLMAGAKHQAIASRLVKEIASLGGDISHFTSPHVAERVREKFAARGVKFAARPDTIVPLKRNGAKPKPKS
jgi:pantetheine-phosphate adenylyltransferase